MKNKTTLYHFILDKSGSMSNCRRLTIRGFNQQLKTIRGMESEFPEQKFKLSLTIFDDHVEHLICGAESREFTLLSEFTYRPKGQTALLDAIGESVNRIRMANETSILEGKMSIVVIILTDGQENASRSFTYQQIADSISALEETGNWTFTFLGADIDARHTSRMLNINQKNIVSFDKSDMEDMMTDISEGMRLYSVQKSKGAVKTEFLDFLPTQDRRKF